MSDNHFKNETDMEASAFVPTEIADVNKEPGIIDLKRLRETRGLTIKDIFSITRITATNLEAIEAGHYHLLPEPVYARTFIKTYAGILETDSRPILQQYETYLASLDKSHVVPEDDQKNLPKKEKKTLNMRLIYWGVAAIVLLALAISVFFIDFNHIADILSSHNINYPKIFSSSPTPEQAPESPIEQNMPTAMPVVSPPPVVSHSEQGPVNKDVSGKRQEQTLSLKVEAVEKTWIRISPDQKQSEQLIMNKGDRLERTAKEFFIIDVGNAGGIMVSLQDKPLPPLGKRGEVMHIKLP